MAKKSFRWFLISFLVISACYVLAFRSLFQNFTTHLLDWNDYPFYVWTLYQHIGHIQSFQLDGFFTSNIFHPYQGNLLFSDLLLPSSLIALVFSLFSNNPILVFNLTFSLTLALNIGASYFFWSQVFKSPKHVFLATFLLSVSPVFFQNTPHFQFISWWQFFMGLGFLLKNQRTTRNAVLVGGFVGLQFLNGMYLAIFLAVAAGFWYLIQFFEQPKKTERIALFQHWLTMTSTVVITCGVFLAKYYQVKQAYGVTRMYWEYIYYALNITDYLFTSNYQSLLTRFWPMMKWNSYNRAGSFYPGSVLALGTLMSLIRLKKHSQQFLLGIRFGQQDILFLIFMAWGFIASLGPRLRVNDVFANIPLPYDLIVRTLPLVEPIRVNSRWALFLFIGAIYFTVRLVERMKKKQWLVMSVCVLLPIIEVLPVYKKTEAKEYYSRAYESLENVCPAQPQVMLEYPITQDREGVDIVSNLTYRTQQMLASVRHRCTLVNGYMGYEPPDYARYEQQISHAVNVQDSQLFWQLLNEKQVRYLKLNIDDLYSEKVSAVESFFVEYPGVKILYQDQTAIVYEIDL